MKKVLLSYFFVLFSGSLLCQDPHKEGKATFVVVSHSFGLIKEENEVAIFVFKFTNTGPVPLIIKDVQTACNCTTVNWPEKPVLPGKIGAIKVTYHLINRSGSFEQLITVFFDGKPGSQVLKINGTIIPKPGKLSKNGY
jgi:hypothetical protein